MNVNIYKVFIILVSVVIFSQDCFALKDNLKRAAVIATHGARFQSERIKIAAENLANEYSIATAPGGDPYNRKVIFAQNQYDKHLGANVITIKKIDTDNAPFIIKYDPYNPAADANGFVKYPNIKKEIERVDAIEAQRSYEANLSVHKISTSMMQKTIESIR